MGISRNKLLTVHQFRVLYGDEAKCVAQLSRMHWPEGFRCLRCGGASRGYMVARRLHECAACGYQASVTAGTIFHKTRTPLTSWFWAIYRMSSDKKGISAVQLAKEIGVSYPTAWLMQHKIRKAMADRDRGYTLSGLIEADEGYVGGEEHGEAQKGRGAKSKQVVAVAVERVSEGRNGRPPIPGFAALAVLPDAGADSLNGFLTGLEHTAVKVGREPGAASRLFPWVHITLSNLKRFLLGTHHQVANKHLSRYVAEFNYRLNPRTMEQDLLTRLLRAAILTHTITYSQLTKMPELAS